ncbi:MAG: 3',5'-cyclic adenosine monophosphate phosphodiesterase CpdA [ANME-2 cluster archaeon]|nr:3',5'-cyclic adenosine monophosphate phosphodiesterase CpdA [ANME-2 cluster archaeon]
MTCVTRIVHLSDIHASSAHFLPDVAGRVVDSINEIAPDIVVVTGDLTQNGYYPEFAGAKELIDRIDCENKVIVPGNHDSRSVGYLLFEDLFGARSSCHASSGVTVVGVDSSQPDVDDGHVGRERYDWIAKSFETDDFKVFALHHHLIPVPMTGREEEILVDSGDVLELLDSCGVNLVLCGHRHVPYVWRLNEMFVANAGTACSNKILARTTQCYNLIEIDDGDLRIYRVLPSGEQELVVDTMMG